MHRHGFKGKKFNRQRDQRRALIIGLTESLILRESVETTLVKAKATAAYTEKLITKSKRGGLHSRRQIIASLSTVAAGHKLIDDITPKLKGRNSGYLRIKRTRLRRGDAAQLATVSFVDQLNKKSTVAAAEAIPKTKES